MSLGTLLIFVGLWMAIQEKTGEREFVESMVVLIFELLPPDARERILADGARASENIVDLLGRKPHGE